MTRPRYDGLITFCHRQAEFCDRLGSPFNGELCRRAAAALGEGDELEGLLAEWAERGFRATADAAVVLRLLGALHDLALSGDAPAMTAAYPRPGAPGDPEAAWRIGRAAMQDQRGRFTAFLGHEPQTNEVCRSAVLLGGFLTIAAETGLPLRCFELGASAGLNLNWDRFSYRLGEHAWGPAGAPVSLNAGWEGPPPPLDAKVDVLERAACDRRPVDLPDPAQRRRLLAFIWPDQFERLDAARAAIQLALDVGVEVETADAGDFAERAPPRPGAATVLYHSIFWQYLPAETKARIEATAQAHGAEASGEAPFAWLRMEPPPGDLTSIELRLTLWPGGEERRLAIVHPHGTWIRWGG